MKVYIDLLLEYLERVRVNLLRGLAKSDFSQRRNMSLNSLISEGRKVHQAE